MKTGSKAFGSSLFARPAMQRHSGKSTLAILALGLMTGSAAAQTVSLSSTSLSFANQVIGSTSGTKKVTLTNTGTSALSISNIATDLPFAQTNTCGTTVAAGAKCTISVTFTPTTTGSLSGSVTITDNASTSPQSIALTGIGVQPVSVAPSSKKFTSTAVGITSAPISFTLTNNLSTALTIFSISTTGDFSQTNPCGGTLNAKSKCTISVTFTPTVVGTRTGTLTVSDDASNSPQTASLSGTGSTAGLVSIAVTPANAAISTGSTQQFNAMGTFSAGYTYDLTQSVTWSSSKTRVATISNAAGSKGLASAVATGTATIKATSGSISSSTTLTVNPSLVSIAVTPAAASIASGNTQQYTATGTYSDGSTQTLTSSVTWSSSASNVATISGGGLATGVGTGNSTISAVLGSVSGATTLTVNPAALVSLAVTPANSSIATGTTQQFKAVGTYTDGSTQDLTATVTWSVSNAAAATIGNSPGSQGLATGVASGFTTVSATSDLISSSADLTVTAATHTLTSITVSPEVASIGVGATQPYTATGSYDDGSTQDLTTSVTWSSSATHVATVSNTAGSEGVATGVATGSSTISATLTETTGGANLTIVNTPCSGPCVPTYHNNLARDGVMGVEAVLTPANVNSSTFGRVAAIVGLNGQIYAQPLYMSGLYSISPKGNAVFAATQQNYVYAFDADSYQQIWGGSYIPASEAPLTTGTGQDMTCGNITPNVGITGTPVIDPKTDFNPNPVMYFVTKSVDGDKNYHQRLHAVDVVTGAEVFGGPVEITTPLGSPENFDPLRENQRSGLALTYDASLRPQIYIAWGSHCDAKEYHGWVMKFTVSSGILGSLPSAYFLATRGLGAEGGIWMGGAAPAADSSTNGNLYLVTGNGDYDGVVNFGNSILKLDSNLGVADWYTPNDWACLNGIVGNSNCPADKDLGSGGVVLFDVVDGVPELVTAGKKGEFYVMYQQNMGHLDPLAPPPNYTPPPNCTTGAPFPNGGANNIAQCFPGIVTPATGAGGSRSTPALWNGTFYVAGSGDALRAFSLSSSGVGTFNTSSAVATTPSFFPYPGSAVVVSWNGSDISTGVAWTLQNTGFIPPARSFILRAYTAVPNGSSLTSLYQSTTGPGSIKFQVPTVANGKVFVGGQGLSASGTEGQLYIYGLCPCN